MSVSSTGEGRKESCLEWLVLWLPWALPCKLPLSDFFRTIDTSPMLPCLKDKRGREGGGTPHVNKKTKTQV